MESLKPTKTREQLEAETVGQIESPDTYLLVKADEKAMKSGEDPKALYESLTHIEASLMEKKLKAFGYEIRPPQAILDRETALKNKEVAKFTKAPKRPIPNAIPIEKVYQVINKWDDTENPQYFKYYTIAAYLFAGRVSETLKLKRSDFDIVSVDGVEYLKANMFVQKKRSDLAFSAIREPVVPFSSYEGMLTKAFYDDYLENFEKDAFVFGGVYPRKALRAMHKINVGTVKAIQVVDGIQRPIWLENFRTTNHYWRHVRCSHLKVLHGYDDGMLQKFIGWSDSRMAARYTHLDIEDMARKYKKTDEMNPLGDKSILEDGDGVDGKRNDPANQKDANPPRADSHAAPKQD